MGTGGTLAPGGAGGGIGTLTVNGNLGLAGGSTLNYVLGEQTVGGALNDLTAVKGNLTLAGTLNVALNPDGIFEPGIYTGARKKMQLVEKVRKGQTADHLAFIREIPRPKLLNTLAVALGPWITPPASLMIVSI